MMTSLRSIQVHLVVRSRDERYVLRLGMLPTQRLLVQKSAQRHKILPTEHPERPLLVLVHRLQSRPVSTIITARRSPLTSGARSENRLSPIRRAAGTPVAVRWFSLGACRNK